MSVSAAVAPRRGVWVFRPRLRLRELFLLCAVAVVLAVGDLSLGMVRTHEVQVGRVRFQLERPRR